MYMNDASSYLQLGRPFPHIGLVKIPIFMFADDMFVLASSETSLQTSLKLLQRHALHNFYQFNPDKCFTFGDTTLSLHGIPIPQTSDFKYLGLCMNSSGLNIKKSLADILANASNVTIQLMFSPVLVWPRSVHQQSLLVTTFTRPKLEYGLQILKYNTRQIIQLDNAMLTSLRQVF